MQKVSMLLMLALFLLSCQPEELGLDTDLNFSVKTKIQNSKDKSGTNSVKVKNIEALRKLPIPNKLSKEVTVLGYYEPHDGGGGVFEWNPVSTEKDNGGTIILSTDVEMGRWERVFNGPVNVKWFGAKGDGLTDESVFFQNALNVQSDLFIPVSDSLYLIKKPLRIKSNIFSDGAILSSDVEGITLLIIYGVNDVKLSGLKINGKDTIIGLNRDFPLRTTGVLISKSQNIEVVNCEIMGWSYGGVNVVNSKNIKVTGNYIHHNQRTGFGYGVVMSRTVVPTNMSVTHNFFEFNRHDIAASGHEGQEYIAAYNIIGRGSKRNHRFDMHGKNSDTEIVAGTRIVIYRNTFLSDIGLAIKIRGIPEKGAEIYENSFAHEKKEDAIMQTVLKAKINELQNVDIFDNTFGIESVN